LEISECYKTLNQDDCDGEKRVWEPDCSLALAQLGELKSRLFDKLNLLKWDNPHQAVEAKDRRRFDLYQPINVSHLVQLETAHLLTFSQRLDDVLLQHDRNRAYLLQLHTCVTASPPLPPLPAERDLSCTQIYVSRVAARWE
jgi:hypothetical protein